MKRSVVVLIMLCAALPALAASLGSSARAAIPSEVQQLISVDYRRVSASETAQALKAKIVPDNLKQFETALRGIGVVPERDVDQLAFALYRNGRALRVVGVAQGTFSTKRVLKKLSAEKIRPMRHRGTAIYPMGGGFSMTFLDGNTLLFGSKEAVTDGLDARDGEIPSLNANSTMTDIMGAVDAGAVWSVLDDQGSQNMLRSVLGDGSKLADYDVIKKRVRASRYTMDFSQGVSFDVDVLTSDNMTAATLSSLLQATVWYRQRTANPVERAALQGVTVDHDSDTLKMHFSSDDKNFQALMNSDLFAAISR